MENGEQKNEELYDEFCKLEEEHHRLSTEVKDIKNNNSAFWHSDLKADDNLRKIVKEEQFEE